ncbi:MAG: HAD family phosphatase [Cyanobacteria bacterium P01_C01_bin.73]
MLKAVCLGFSGVVVRDLAVHQRLVEQILLDENLRPNADDYRQVCLGRSDRACLTDLFAQRGRVLPEAALNKLVKAKSERYQSELKTLDKLPLYSGLDDLIFKLRAAQLPLAIVTGVARAEVEAVLTQAKLIDHFAVIVAGDELPAGGSKPAPDAYLLAVERFNQVYPEMQLTVDQCLTVEDAFPGIEAAHRAGIKVVGVAHTYPFRMMQRRADWVVDYLFEVDLDWIRRVYLNPDTLPTAG